MKERDRLLEQTLAFVQGVTGQRPAGVASVVVPAPASVAAVPVVKVAIDPSSAETDALISMMAMAQPADAAPLARAPDPIAVADPPQPMRAAAKAPIHQAAARQPIDLVLPERDLIAQRVARFRARQQKTLQDREIDYAAAQAKIRATLGNDPSAF